MARELTKIVYSPSVEASEEYIVIVNPAEYKRWKDGAEVVDSFQVFWSNQGAQGLLGRPSNQQLENVFGSSKDVDVVKQILEKGKEESGKSIRTGIVGKDMTKGSMTIDTKGKGLTGI
ncbi:DUF1960-domain-containing protein [Lentinus tigrinus ALCF2SS1-7]|uniref:DUF1960-domain-containing protein n=1 Tax=Lentinus tigrinus ALCF2SS1-6 TaxID=1328759 RepID=A0A5C2SV64_9APHY|nr:DUF1960-domain-containing protein [Lentinus tigrinus ALCF2SS1-6]RPD80885.1 DUF1960-domain-containing protein [Lentinus tigrinus ALCF2SS1-7]